MCGENLTVLLHVGPTTSPLLIGYPSPLMTKVTCSLTKEISVQHVYDFERDDKGEVTVTSYYEGVKAESSQITIPRDCIQPFINTLEQFK